MYTQEECMVSPHHFTHLGVCYEGDVAYITLSNPDNPQPVQFTVGSTPASVPEPSVALLFAAAALVAFYEGRRRSRIRRAL